MSQTGRVITGIVVIAVVTVVLGLAYIWISGGSGEASAPITAPTLAIATTAPTTAATEEATEVAATSEATTAPTAEATEAVTEVAATAEATEAATAESTEADEATEAASAMLAAATTEATEVAATAEATPEATTEATTEAAAAPESNLVVFNIASEQSEVRFTLSEVLNGSPKTVVGSTDQVAGQIAVDFGNPQASQVGEIRINVRTLATDSGMRDRMIRGQILESSRDEYEFASFVPTAISGLPESITLGEPITFQITGDLTLRTITQPVTFDVTVMPESETQISGTAVTTVQRADFELNIPRVPSVADVSEEVKLEIEFVALPAV
jgi:polyisoprenoid-binding protein YceI